MKILLISNMYPSKKYPAYGIFVQNQAALLKENGFVLHKIVMKKSSRVLQKLVSYSFFLLQNHLQRLVWCI